VELRRSEGEMGGEMGVEMGVEMKR